MNSSKIGTPHHHPTTYNRKVGSQNTSKSNKNSVFSLLNRCKPSLEESYSILFIHKTQAHPTNPTHRQVIPNIILPWEGTSPHVGAGTSPSFFGPPDSFHMHPSQFQLPFYMPSIPCHPPQHRSTHLYSIVLHTHLHMPPRPCCPPTDAPTCLHYCSTYGSVHTSILHASTYASNHASVHTSMVMYLPYFYC